MASLDPNTIDVNTTVPTVLRSIREKLVDWFSNGINFGSSGDFTAIGANTAGTGKFTTLEANTLQLDTAVPASPAANVRYQGSGAEHFISSTTLNAASHTITLPGDARFARIIVTIDYAIVGNSGDNILLQFNADTGANYSGGVVANRLGLATPAGAVFSGATSISLSNVSGVANTSTKGFSGSFEIVQPGSTVAHKVLEKFSAAWQITAAADWQQAHGGFEYLATAALTSMKLFTTTASGFTSGVCNVYGRLAV